MIKKIVLPFALTAIFTACSPATNDNHYKQVQGENPSQSAPSLLNTLVEEQTLNFIIQQPLLATVLAVPVEQAGGRYNDRFPDYSAAGMARLQDAMGSAALQLSAINLTDVDEKIRLHQQVVIKILRYYAGYDGFSGGYIDTWGGHLPYIINQISGPLIDIPKVMQVQQAVNNRQDAQDYLTRLGKFEQLVNQVVGKFAQDQKNGIILPAKLHPKTLAYLDSFLASEPKEHALVSSFTEKLLASDLDIDTQQALTKQAIELVSDVVYPAYQKARLAVKASAKIAKSVDGIWSQPKGNKFYLHAIRYLGDSSQSADEIHNIGLDEVARITQQMDSILLANGYEQGSVGERMVTLATQPEFLYPDSDAGRATLLNDLNRQVAAIMAKAPTFYNTIPRQKVAVKRIPQVSEAGEAGGFYTPPSLDGSRSGIYWINLRDMSAVPKFALKTLTYHEAVPGHHFQIALNMAQQDIGLLRQNAPFNAYVEGWALYSELVAKQMGMYENDPWGDLGRLQAELYRAVRLVVDTGLHRKKWTREEAIDYFHKTTGTSMTDVTAEVERYMAWPGQALGYKLGMLQFIELRNMAEQTLGNKFDLLAFHDLLLLPGARPMSIVRADVERWVAQQSQ
ncbi:MAG: hypothetical protein ACI9C4_002627 [Paraglaciecola sp.]|jgi:uncharacterized protein (DUF885 family)